MKAKETTRSQQSRLKAQPLPLQCKVGDLVVVEARMFVGIVDCVSVSQLIEGVIRINVSSLFRIQQA